MNDQKTYKAQKQELTPDEIKAANTANNAKVLKVAAKGVANVYTGGKFSGLIDKVADSKLAQKAFEKSGKIATKIGNNSIQGRMAQKAINKLSETGTVDAADKVASGLTSKQDLSKMSDFKSSSLKTAKDEGEADNKAALIKKKIFWLKIIGIAVGVFGFIFLVIGLIYQLVNGFFTLNISFSNQSQGSTSTNQPVNVQYTDEEIEKALVYIGDSRTVGLKDALNNNNITFIAETGTGLDYLKNNVVPTLGTYLTSDKKFMVLAFGVNDLGNIDNYISYYKELITMYPNLKIYFLSVNPVNEELAKNNNYSVTNSDIDSFNQKLSDSFKDNYIDSNSQIVNSIKTTDGIHYEAETYKTIHSIVLAFIKSNNSKGTATFLDNYPLNGGGLNILNVSLIDKLGEEEFNNYNNNLKNSVNTAGKCTGNAVAMAAISLINGAYQYGFVLPYYWGGGHSGKIDGIDKNWGSIIQTVYGPSGTSYNISGLDCSGFVTWAINQSGISAYGTTSDYANTGTKEDFYDAKPGDILDSPKHIILVIENKKDYLITAEAKGKNYGIIFSKYTKDEMSNYTAYDMTEYYKNNCS